MTRRHRSPQQRRSPGRCPRSRSRRIACAPVDPAVERHRGLGVGVPERANRVDAGADLLRGDGRVGAAGPAPAAAPPSRELLRRRARLPGSHQRLELVVARGEPAYVRSWPGSRVQAFAVVVDRHRRPCPPRAPARLHVAEVLEDRLVRRGGRLQVVGEVADRRQRGDTPATAITARSNPSTITGWISGAIRPATGRPPCDPVRRHRGPETGRRSRVVSLSATRAPEPARPAPAD